MTENWMASVVNSVLSIWGSNAGGFVFVSLGFMIVAYFLASSTRREMKQLRHDLDKCTDKHVESQRAADAVAEKMSNLKISVSALFVYAMLSGDKRLSGVSLDDLLDGKIAITVIDTSAQS